MNDDPKKPAGDSQGGSEGDAAPVDSASPQRAGLGPSRNEDAAELPGDEGLRALYAQLPDVAPRAELDEAILAASREVLRGVASNRDRSSRRSGRERATRVLRWGLPVAAAASVMFVVLREHRDLVPQAEFAANPSPREEQASKPNQEHAGRISEPPSAPAEHAERDESASPQFAPPAPPPAVEWKRKAAPASPMADAVHKAAPASPEARAAAREAFDSSAAIRDERARNDAPSPTKEGRAIPVPPPAGSAAPAIPAPSVAESADLANSAPPARGNELRSAPAAAMPKSEDSSSTASALGALAAKETTPGLSITEVDKPWPLGLEFSMSTEAACAKLRALSSRGCVLHNEVAVVELDEAWRLTSGVHEGRWIVAVKLIAKDGRITKLDLTERQLEKE